MLGDRPPHVASPLPGPVAAAWVDALARTECPSLTARRARRAERSGVPHDPIVWAEAKGSNVCDADGNVFVDLTSGFGVALLGHAHPRIVRAIVEQSARCIHALGDVHPSIPKLELLAKLAELAPVREPRIVLGLNGSDAIGAALKTAMLHTHRAGVIAFEGAYHGLMYAPLALCGYRESFRAPFAAQLNPHVRFAPYPASANELARALATFDALLDRTVGAVVIEPMLGRGGAIVPPPELIPEIAARCRKHGALLIADEVFTGLGRTGPLWASEGMDLVCVGKALGGGMPISACLGTADVMAAWGDPDGEAIHTATFAGNPLACAAALAVLHTIEEEDVPARARERGEAWLSALSVLERHACVRAIRGRGLMIGIELDSGPRALAVVRAMLERGFILLPAGADARVLSLTPPLTVSDELVLLCASELDRALEARA
jgi:4-aminobutyrate aminotransferase / (S)-3-amino-2-methylpropionate transaminase / 5-aminovalerate transaminase